MRKGLTEVVFILDRSGSMRGLEEDTIGGFVFGLLGRKPEEGDRVVTGGWRFEVTEAEGFRVTRVKATMLQEDGTAVQADE